MSGTQRKRARNLLKHDEGRVFTGDDLLHLFFELDCTETLQANALASLAGVSQKYNRLVREKVTLLEITSAEFEEGQRLLNSKHLFLLSGRHHGVGDVERPTRTSRSRSKVQQPQDNHHQQSQAGPAPCAGEAASLPAYLAQRMPKLCHLRLLFNTILQSTTFAHQLELISQVPQLTALQLRDAVSWALPSAALSHISKLQQLGKLQLLIQSPGMRSGVISSTHSSWTARVSQALTAVSSLTGLHHLQLRFICGERGYFSSSKLLPAVRSLTQLTHLDLGYVDLAPAGLQQLSDMPHMESLILYGRLSMLTAQDFTMLQHLPKLRRLEMFHDCPSHLDGLPAHNADELQLSVDEAAELVGVLNSTKQLTWLNLPMVRATMPLLPLLQHLPALEQLYLQSIEREQPALPLTFLSSMGPLLTVLQVDNIKLSRQGLSSLVGFSQLEQLTLFNLQLQDLGSLQALSQLSQLSRMKQFCFDALTADDPDVVAILDNNVLRAIAPCWQQLHSLHVSYTALPESAVLTMTAFSELQALQHLSLYCSPHAAQEQVDQGRDLLLDCAALPPGLKSMSLSALALKNVSSLPVGLQHLWLSDVIIQGMQPPDSLLRSAAPCLGSLETLVLRVAWPTGDFASAPVQNTDDLEFLVRHCGRLTCLGLSLVAGSNASQLVDLRALAPLTGMKQLLLDYCCEPPNAGQQHGVQHQQQQQQPAPPAHLPPLVPWHWPPGGPLAGQPLLPVEQNPLPANMGPLAALVQQQQQQLPAGQGQVPVAGPGQQQQQVNPAAAAAAAAMPAHAHELQAAAAALAQAAQAAQAVAQEAAAVQAAAAQAAAAAPALVAAAQILVAAAQGAGNPAQAAAALAAIHGALAAHDQQGAAAAAGAPLPQPVLEALGAAGAAAAAAGGAGGAGPAPLPQPVVAALNAAGAAAAAAGAAAAAEEEAGAAAAAAGGQVQPVAPPQGAQLPLQLPPPPPPPPPAAGPPVVAAAGGQALAAGNGVGILAGGGGVVIDLDEDANGPDEQLMIQQQLLASGARLDGEEVVDQLAQLSQTLTRLRGVWLSDNVIRSGAGLGLQQLLALGAPRVVVRSATSDWFWGTNFPIGSSLEGENPLTWWKFTPWSIL